MENVHAPWRAKSSSIVEDDHVSDGIEHGCVVLHPAVGKGKGPDPGSAKVR